MVTLKYFLTDESPLKGFLTSEDLSVPHVCGVLARHFGTCPACEEVKNNED